MTHFKPLPVSTLAQGTSYARHYFHAPNLVRLQSSALEVMTDLRFVSAETVRGDVTLEAARQRMIVRGVRSLLVENENESIIGIITARDLESERRTDAASDPVAPAQTLVAHVMTPGPQIEVMHIDDVLHAHVGDIVETLKHSGRQHALVVETDPMADVPVIRGMFSASQIARQLGIAPDADDLAATFASIDQKMKA